MNVELMTKLEAINEFEYLINENFEVTRKLSGNYEILREKLVNKYYSIKDELRNSGQISNVYLTDVKFGLYLYEQTNVLFKLKDNIAIASDEKFWIYINLVVIPDIVYDRWISASNKATRFYSHTKRIYTNSLWWYIHLTWQGTSNTTYDTIEKMNTDVLLQLVERSGGGYNLIFTRKLFKSFSDIDDFTNFKFRFLMKWHTLYVKTIQPEFYKGGVDGYIEMLLSKY